MKLSVAEKIVTSGHSGIDSVGAWLKVTREAQGETLDNISKVTRIGKNYLQAIEEGALSKLPSQAYTRGFIRLYAAHLGLSPEEALSMMDRSLSAPLEINPTHLSDQQLERKPLSPFPRSLLLIAVLALALVSGYIFLKSTQSSNPPENISSINTSQSDKTRKAPDMSQGQTAPNSDLSHATTIQPTDGVIPHKDGIVLRLKAVGDGRVHIIIDGSVSQEYDLVAGDLVEWKAENTFQLDLENAASVEGELDGIQLKPFGEPGKAAHLVLNADGTHTGATQILTSKY